LEEEYRRERDLATKLEILRHFQRLPQSELESKETPRSSVDALSSIPVICSFEFEEFAGQNRRERKEFSGSLKLSCSMPAKR
jgi:hypothetical protein